MQHQPDRTGKPNRSIGPGSVQGDTVPVEFTCGEDAQLHLAGLPESAGQVLDALDTMSRRIDDLARELNCLGYFDDDDSPKAA